MRISDVGIARTCHEATRALQNALGDPCPSEPWDALSPEARQSTLSGVRQAERDPTLQQMHDAWVSYKLQRGWTLGNRKDENLKTHPNLVPYDQLPDGEKLKVVMFLAIFRVLREHHAEMAEPS